MAIPAVILVPGLVAGTIAAVVGARAWRRARRLRAVQSVEFPPSVARAVAKRWPHLSTAQVDRVLAGLRSYLGICARARMRTVAMPSLAIDEAWHQFILSTRHYERFCQDAFGRYLHHAPASDMPTPRASDAGLRRCWRVACAMEGLDPRHPARLPTVFALDSDLDIPDGYRFAVDCRRQATQPTGKPGTTILPYCATELGCSGSGCSGGGPLSCAGAADGHGGHGGGDGAGDAGGDGGGGDGGGCSGGCGGGD